MPPAERRTVAVLFSDLSGFTALSESMDPEDVRDLVDALFARFRRVIEARGGTVDKFIGDAVMAVFGAPVAHEDDALRAVRVALAMQGELEGFNRERKLELRLRVGVNAGEVLWGGVGGDRATAMGDAVNVAQRLEAAAGPGTVLVSDSVRAATGGRIRTRDAGELALKGRREAVRAHEVLGEDRGGSESAIIEGIAAPIFGREAELARLQEMWKRGSASVVVIEGEAGIGKSRLVAELRRRARADGGVAVFSGRALPEAPISLAPFAEIARQGAGPGDEEGARVAGWFAAGIGEGPVAARQGDLIALALGFALPASRRNAMDVEAAREETPAAWRDWIRALTASRRVLICVEDLHWADAATGELAAMLAREAAPGRALVVATTRPGAVLPPCELVRLTELSAEAVRAVAQAALHQPVSAGVTEFLKRQSGGNPYFVEELARYLRRQGLLAGAPLEMTGAPDRVPDTLLGVLVARLDTLAPACREALKAASVLGRVFQEGLLAGLAGPDASAALAEARDGGLVLPAPTTVLPGEPALQFRHALLRDAAYGLLTKRDRAAFHRAAAEALEPMAASAGRVALTLAAGHREAAGDVADAARLHRRVAAEAAHSNCAESLAAAREAVRLEDGAAARYLLADALYLLGKLPEAVRECEVSLASTGATPLDRAHAADLRTTLHLHQGEFSRALDAAAAIDPSQLGPEWELYRRAQRASALLQLGKPDEALRECDDTVAEDAGDGEIDKARSALFGRRAAVLMRLDRIEEALEFHYRTRAIHQKRGDARGLAISANNVAASLFRLSRFAEARAGLEEALAAARRLGISHAIEIILTNLGAISNRQHQYAGAEELLREALAIRTVTGDVLSRTSSFVNLGRSLVGQGKLAEAAGVFEEGLAVSRGLEDPFPRLRLTMLLARVDLDRGVTRAEDLLGEAARGLAGNPAFASEPSGMLVQGRLLLQEGRLHLQAGRSMEAERTLEGAFRILDAAAEFEDSAETILLRASLGGAGAMKDLQAGLALSRRIGDAWSESWALAGLGFLEAKEGHTAEARSWLARAELTRGAGRELNRLRYLLTAARAHEVLGDAEAAARLRAEANAIAERTGAFGLLKE